MSHRTRVIKTSAGYAGICSCGYVTDEADQTKATVAINDHELAALRSAMPKDPVSSSPAPERTRSSRS